MFLTSDSGIIMSPILISPILLSTLLISGKYCCWRFSVSCGDLASVGSSQFLILKSLLIIILY